MTAINPYQIAMDSTDTWLDYTASEYCDILDNFFIFKNHPQIQFYNIPQGALFSGSVHKKVQRKQRILEYRAKY